MAPSTPSARVTVVVGTRPELVKMAPVIDAIESSEVLSLRFLHTGQHYDDALSGRFLDILDLPDPDEHLDVGSGPHAEQTAAAAVAIDRDLDAHCPAAVLAQGDTNAVLSTALAASKRPIPFGHVEAGIRSFDRSMPEEVNRVLADHVSEFLFAPTDVAAENLHAEGVDGHVHVTGNTVVDVCRQYRPVAEATSTLPEGLSLDPDRYVAATIHRPRNTDDLDRLTRVVDALDGSPLPVAFPAHPRTQESIDDIDLDPDGSLRLLDPLDYVDFLALLSNARAVVTDSGGIQEEASILEVPCLTVRPNTERPETIDAGVNELVSPDELAGRLRAVVTDEHEGMVGCSDLYGDGDAGERIVSILEGALTDVQPDATSIPRT